MPFVATASAHYANISDGRSFFSFLPSMAANAPHPWGGCDDAKRVESVANGCKLLHKHRCAVQTWSLHQRKSRCGGCSPTPPRPPWGKTLFCAYAREAARRVYFAYAVLYERFLYRPWRTMRPVRGTCVPSSYSQYAIHSGGRSFFSFLPSMAANACHPWHGCEDAHERSEGMQTIA